MYLTTKLNIWQEGSKHICLIQLVPADCPRRDRLERDFGWFAHCSGRVILLIVLHTTETWLISCGDAIFRFSYSIHFLSLHHIYWKYIKYQLTGSPFKVLQSIIWKALFFSCFSFKSYWTLIECPDGTYGKYCLRRCNCPEAVRCDHVHGKCDVTCPAGLTGPNCQKGNERLLP